MAIQQNNPELIELIAVNFQRKSLPIIVFGAFSGYMHREVELVDTDAFELVPDSNEVYSVFNVLHYEALVVVDSGSFNFAAGELSLDDNDTLYTDADLDVVLTVSADGGVTLALTGTPSARLQIRMIWM